MKDIMYKRRKGNEIMDCMNEIIKECKNANPSKLYYFICTNAWDMGKNELKDIILELLYVVEKRTHCPFYGSLYSEIMDEVGTNLQDLYSEDE